MPGQFVIKVLHISCRPVAEFRAPLNAEDLLSDLNPSQREAVTAPTGPLLVVAGAGTGKTRVLTRRVAWRILHGLDPRSILAITFTNKAAGVLKERLFALPGGYAVTAGTFHGFCALLLRRFADRLGRSTDFTILDKDDQTRLLRDLCGDLKIDTTAYRPVEFGHAISHRKNGGAGRMPALLSDGRFVEHLEKVAAGYGRKLLAASLFDFDDLLLEAVRVLEEAPDALESARARWSHLLVDEYQDTNAIQSRLLKLLAGEAADLTVVGDPDQSIYRWRGASIRNILGFRQDYPNARVVALEENYRSTSRILAAAEAVIAGNTERIEKRLRTSNPAGERVQELRSNDALTEGRRVAELLAQWRASGTEWAEMAVFFRVNHLSRGVETALSNAGIPYQLVSGTEFFERREVKDVLAYARLLENPRDEAAFARIVNSPRRGIGAGSLEKLRAHATARGVSVPEAASDRVEGISGKARKGLDHLLSCLVRLRSLPRAPVGPLLAAVATETGYRADLLAKEDDLERSRVENVDELVAAAREADRAQPGLTLRDFLERATLSSEQDGFDEKAGRVSLMTAHAAKGLEFDGVIVVGAEEGWFPHARSSAKPEDVEEERRLFYVAMTRARKRLVLTHAAQRESWNGLERRDPSRFLLAIPNDAVETLDATGLYARDRARREGDPRPRFSAFLAREGLASGQTSEVGDDAHDASHTGPVSEADQGSPSADAVYERAEDAIPRPGERVTHPFFGEGALVSTSGAGASLRVTVDFDAVGTKTILWSYARLSRAASGPGKRSDAT